MGGLGRTDSKREALEGIGKKVKVDLKLGNNQFHKLTPAVGDGLAGYGMATKKVRE